MTRMNKSMDKFSADLNSLPLDLNSAVVEKKGEER